jgi:hypothetical protein
MRYPLLHAALASSLTLALGCSGEASAPPAKAPPSPPPQAAKAPASPPVPSGHLARREVDQVLTKQGPPWLLRRVMREETYDKAGKFAGWRITGLPEEWSAVDLHPGDVVKRVNGMPLETPDNAWEAWKSVAKARELRVSLERDGAARELVVPIDGEPSAEVIQALSRDTPPPRPPERQRRGVVRIGGDDGSEAETY